MAHLTADRSVDSSLMMSSARIPIRDWSAARHVGNCHLQPGNWHVQMVGEPGRSHQTLCPFLEGGSFWSAISGCDSVAQNWRPHDRATGLANVRNGMAEGERDDTIRA